MKTNIAIIVGFLFIFLSSCESNSTKESKLKIVNKTTVNNGISTSAFTVWGNCGMCEETIENSLKMRGVKSSDWNSDTKIIKVIYDSSKTTLDLIEKRIASVGYDNVKYKADDKVYATLQECCQYERK